MHRVLNDVPETSDIRQHCNREVSPAFLRTEVSSLIENACTASPMSPSLRRVRSEGQFSPRSQPVLKDKPCKLKQFNSLDFKSQHFSNGSLVGKEHEHTTKRDQYLKNFGGVSDELSSKEQNTYQLRRTDPSPECLRDGVCRRAKSPRGEPHLESFGVTESLLGNPTSTSPCRTGKKLSPRGPSASPPYGTRDNMDSAPVWNQKRHDEIIKARKMQLRANNPFIPRLSLDAFKENL